MNGIVCVDKNWAIGKNNKLLVSIPNDMKMFREETMGKTIIMGRKTLESFKGGEALLNRENIVLTRNKTYKKNGVVVLHSKEEVLDYIKDKNSEDVFVIGGESIYKEFLDNIDTFHITKVMKEYEADTFMVNLDEKSDWVVTATSEELTYFDMEYYFIKYEKIK